MSEGQGSGEPLRLRGIHPAGMTGERALQIALRALEQPAFIPVDAGADLDRERKAQERRR